MIRRLLLALGLFLIVLLPASPAQAHAQLIRTNPVQGSVVPNPPQTIEVVFSESISPVKDKIRIVGPDGKRADDGKPTVEGATLRIGLTESKRGTYLVSFRVISADSHPVPGGFTFSIAEKSSTPVEVPQEKSNDTVLWALGIAKYIGYAGLVLLVGAAFVLTALWPRRLERKAPKRLMWVGFGLVALSTLASIYLQAPYTSGGGLSDVEGFDEVMSSRFGIALLVRLAVLAVAAILIRPLVNGTAGPADKYLVGGVAAIGASTWPLAGHPAGSPVPAVSIVVDAIHLGAVALWLGGLVMLAMFLLRLADEAEREAIVPIWSRWAGLLVASVVLAGVVSALIEVGTPSALVGTTYGRYVLVKVGLVAGLILVASQSRRLLRTAKLRNLVIAELAIATVVMGFTSALTQTTPARTAEAIANTPPAPVSQSYTTTLESPLYRLQIEIDPAKLGDNLVHLYAYTPQGQPLKVLEWKVTAALPAAGIEPIDVPLLDINKLNHVSGTIALPTPGDWQFKFTLRITEIDQDSVTTTVQIS